MCVQYVPMHKCMLFWLKREMCWTASRRLPVKASISCNRLSQSAATMSPGNSLVSYKPAVTVSNASAKKKRKKISLNMFLPEQTTHQAQLHRSSGEKIYNEIQKQ